MHNTIHSSIQKSGNQISVLFHVWEEIEREKEKGQTDGELNRFGDETRRRSRESPKDEIRKHKEFTKVESSAAVLAAVMMGSMYFWCVEDVIQDSTLLVMFSIHPIVHSSATRHGDQEGKE